MPPVNPQAIAKASARYVRVSPQKARLVVDLIRGKRAEDALHLLRFTQKRIAADVAKLLQSAIANATERLELDVDALYISHAVVNEGPRQKRIRPAPMGRAYRYQRRSAHIEIHVAERPGAVMTRTVEEPKRPAGAAVKRAKPAAAGKPGAKKAAKKPAKKKRSTIAKLANQRSKPSASPARKGGSKNKGGE